MTPGLDRLADLYGLHTSYIDAFGTQRSASESSLLATLRCLGAPVASSADVPQALEALEQQLSQDLCEPVHLATASDHLSLPMQVPDGLMQTVVDVDVLLEDGACRNYAVPVADCSRFSSTRSGCTGVLLRVDQAIPVGYHQLHLRIAGLEASPWILAAPDKALAIQKRQWGAFAPLYALQETVEGPSDFGTLQRCVDFIRDVGGHAVATLPLLPTFLDDPYDPSPYAPVSRLFWNEYYLDFKQLMRKPEGSAAAVRQKAPAVLESLEELAQAPFLDYRQEMKLKRQLLEQLAEAFFAQSGSERDAFTSYFQAHPLLAKYAAFRAETERRKTSWRNWAVTPHVPADASDPTARYHAYVQWRAAQQLDQVSEDARSLGMGLYLDLPVGVHGAGFDVYHAPEEFLEGTSLGAPADPMFSQGQHWGTTPMHPRKIRESGYRYFRDSIQHHARVAGGLRIDHIMGLHRAYCIPDGAAATEGVYVKYRPEELYAVLKIESERNNTVMFGEDLGTVPEGVREAMRDDGIYRMHVVQYELEDTQANPFASVPEDSVASLNTHDMPPFISWWTGSDIDARDGENKLSLEDMTQAKAGRKAARELILSLASIDENSPEQALRWILSELMRSQAGLCLINLEDLWLESRPQNIPGTGHERPNWRRRLSHPLDSLRELAEVRQVLSQLSEERRKHG